MTDINLIAIKSKQNRYDSINCLLFIVAPIIIGVILIYSARFHYKPILAEWVTKNDIIKKQSDSLNKEIIDPKILAKDERTTKQIINALDTISQARYQGTELFKIITTITPVNVFLLSMNNKKGNIELIGQTYSKQSVSTLLSRLSELTFTSKPKLKEMTTHKETRLNTFKIQFMLMTKPPFYEIKPEKKK